MKKILETNSELKKIKVTTESFNKINKGANYKGHYYTKLIIILRDMKNIIK